MFPSIYSEFQTGNLWAILDSNHSHFQVPPFLLPTPFGVSPSASPLLSSPLSWILQDSCCTVGIDRWLVYLLLSWKLSLISQFLPLRTPLAAVISTVTFCKICFMTVSRGAETLACVSSTSTEWYLGLRRSFSHWPTFWMNKWMNDVFTVWTGKDRSHMCNHYPNTLVLRATYSQEKVFQEMSQDELQYFSCTDFWQLTRQSPSVKLQFNRKDLK